MVVARRSSRRKVNSLEATAVVLEVGVRLLLD
jgi:hypothetical protein